VGARQTEQRELWRQRVTEQEQSGESVRAFCQRIGIAEHIFYARRRSMRGDRPITFALVETKPAAQEVKVIELLMTQGDRLRIPCDESVLRMVLSVLRDKS
jgi:hypothetical protein